MQRSFLTEQLGLDKDVVNEIMREHGKTIQSEKDKAQETIDSLQSQLNEANETISKASESKESIEQIQSELEEYKTKFEEVSGTLESERKTQKIKEALSAKGGTDLEYLMFKLGEVEDLEKLDEHISSLKEQYPNHFSSDSAQNDKKDDVEVVENKLEKGGNNRTFSLEEIGNLSQDEINENWELIAESLKNQ